MTEVFRVEDPGLFTTVQDLGRPNAIASGVTPGGAMDRFAHRAGNLLVGNEPGAATLECTLVGPRLVALRPGLVAITGGDLAPHINGRPVPMWTAVFMSTGDELVFGTRRSGARTYIAISGGVAGDRWLGSLSTYTLVARGGMAGRALIAGDVVGAAAPGSSPAVAGRALPREHRPDYASHVLHAIPGPHAHRLTRDDRETFFTAKFKVSHDANRMGYRLEGPPLDTSGEEVLSFGVTAGAIQLPGGGRPILLMADHQTAGGYPVIAAVAGASMPVAAQLAPGDELVFREVSLEAAQGMRREQQSALNSLRD